MPCKSFVFVLKFSNAEYLGTFRYIRDIVYMAGDNKRINSGAEEAIPRKEYRLNVFRSF